MEASTDQFKLELPNSLVYDKDQTESAIRLSNKSDNILLFKIKSTDCTAVIVDNYEGKVCPWQEKDITVSLSKDLTGKVRLLIIWAFVSPELENIKIGSLPKAQTQSKQIHIVLKETGSEVPLISAKTMEFKTLELDITNDNSLDQKIPISLPSPKPPTHPPKTQVRKQVKVNIKPKLQTPKAKTKSIKSRVYRTNWTVNIVLLGVMVVVCFIGSKLNHN